MSFFRKIGFFILTLAVLFVAFSCKTNVDGDGVVAVKSVKLNKTDLNLTVGQTFDLTATVLPENANEKSVTWTSSKLAVAKVENGKVTALAKGEATITVTTKSGGKTATCNISVIEKNVDHQNPEEQNPSEEETPNSTEEGSELSDVILTFNSNGGAWSDGATIKTISEKPNTALTVPEEPIKIGYTFTGWNPALPEKIPQANTTYTASWTLAGNFVITYELNGGTNSAENPTGYNIETETFELKSATKIGYTFAGWYKDADFTISITQIEKGSMGDVTLYAKWKANTYKVLFDANGGSGTMSEQIFTYDVRQQLYANEFMRKGYNFAGWSTNGDIPYYYGVSYNEDAIVKNLSEENNGTVTLYAIWMPEGDYTITYELNGGINAENPTYYTVESETMTLASPTKLGYNFIGWYKEASFVTEITQIEKGSTGDITLYAKWEAAEVNYTVEYLQENLDGNEFIKFETQTLIGTMGTQTAAVAKSYTGFTAQAITQSTIKADGSTVVQIKYMRNTITLTLDLDGGTGTTTLSGKYGARISFAKPTKKGYTFMGWNPSMPATFTEDVTYTATWEEGYLPTASDVGTTIKSLSGDTTYNIRVRGAISSSTISTIESALQTLYKNSPSTKVELDFSETTGLVSIKDEAFKNCSNLTSIIIPNGVASIGNGAFYSCENLAIIKIPNSVTSIANDAFSGYGYSERESVYVDDIEQWLKISNFYLGNAKHIYINNIDIKNDTSIEIPDGITSIGNGAFSSCSKLTSITIPNSVTSIGGGAFYDCSSLTSINIPNSVTSIGNGAFSGCSKLTSITIPNSVTSIGKEAFYYCKSLTSIAMPNTVTSIESNTFTYCTNLTSVAIPNSVTSIGDGAFLFCSSLTRITIPNSVISIGRYAFSGCSNLTNITLSDNITVVEERMFNNCSKLSSIAIPNGVTSIGDRAFDGCSKLSSITIPNSVTSIGISAFYGCSSLSRISIPSSVTSIGNNAFTYCTSLTSVAIPNSVTLIDGGAFFGCSSLSSVMIPNSVTSIGPSAFYGCSKLTSITIPNSVTSIGSGAFYECSNLTSIAIPDGIVSIGDDTFNGCSSLSSVMLPNSITSIGNSAFENCSNLTSVIIPSRITSIDYRAFYKCSKLADITVEATTPPSLKASGLAFDDNASGRKIYVPSASVNSYKTKWKDYASDIYPIQ